MVSLTAFLIVCCASSPLWADPVSRGGALARALQQNPQLAAARAVEAQSQSRRAQAAAARFPTLTVVAGAGPSLKAKLVPGTGALSTENSYGDVGFNDLSIALGGQLDVLQPLYTFGKIDLRAQAAEHELHARRAQTEMTRAQLAVTVAQLYEGWLFARDCERFLTEVERWLVRARDAAKLGLEQETGVREQDVLRLEAGTGAIRLNLHQAGATMRQAEAALVAYLGFAPGTALEPKEDTLELLPQPRMDRATLVALAGRQRPELSALSEASAAYLALADAEAAGNLPDFFARLFATAAYTPGRDVVGSRYIQDPLNGFYPGVFLGARWQLTGSMASERAHEHEAKARELDHTRRFALAGIPAEVTKAYEDVMRAALDSEAAEQTVAIAKRWSVLASADYSIGLGDIRELTDSTQAFVQLRIAATESKYRHNVALAELARATGNFQGAVANPYYPIREE
jgi:outer membrane protein TolC